MNLNILISCAGKQLPLVKSFVDTLDKQGKVIVADINQYASSVTGADYSIVSPRYSSEKYGNWCLKVCKDYNIGLWISLLEDELIILEDLRESMHKLGCVLVGAPKDNIKKALDKRSYKSFLGHYGINVPDTLTLKELKNQTNIKEGKYIVKNRHGRGSRGIIKVNDVESLMEVAESKQYSESWVAQSIIEGDIFCIDVINDLNGRFVTSLIRKRLFMGAQETDVAEMVDSKEINEVAKKLSLATKHQGCMDVDVIKNGDDLYVIDLNLRFGGSHIFSLMSGTNIPAALIAWRNGIDPDPNWLKQRTGEILTRYSTVVKYIPNTTKI